MGVTLDLLRGGGLEMAAALRFAFGGLLVLQGLAFLPLLGGRREGAARPSA
jgi:hypothetical protein